MLLQLLEAKMRVVLPAALTLLTCTAVCSPLPAADTARVPDFSGLWWHPSLPGPEPLATGPTTVTNRARTPQGFSDYAQLVGDYTNPILKPEAAATVKKFGDMSREGILFPSPANQCWPEPGPYIYKNFAVELFQKPDEITIIYDQDHEIRHIRLDQPHPPKITPSWYGDSVGHYEGGDTLVVDTVGIRTDRPFPMIDLYGTPYSKSLHMVERYRLISYDEAKDGLERNRKENMVVQGRVDPNYRGKYLQVLYTVDDPGVFTTAWSATVTFGRGDTEWPETVCAENFHVYYSQDEKVPTAARPDF
jgi:hypothetical protein